jgi:hypothetical protein
MYGKINDVYDIQENYASVFSIYAALKGNQRRCSKNNQCFCKQTIDGKKVNQFIETCKCGDCRLN